MRPLVPADQRLVHLRLVPVAELAVRPGMRVVRRDVGHHDRDLRRVRRELVDQPLVLRRVGRRHLERVGRGDADVRRIRHDHPRRAVVVRVVGRTERRGEIRRSPESAPWVISWLPTASWYGTPSPSSSDLAKPRFVGCRSPACRRAPAPRPASRRPAARRSPGDPAHHRRSGPVGIVGVRVRVVHRRDRGAARPEPRRIGELQPGRVFRHRRDSRTASAAVASRARSGRRGRCRRSAGRRLDDDQAEVVDRAAGTPGRAAASPPRTASRRT